MASKETNDAVKGAIDELDKMGGGGGDDGADSVASDLTAGIRLSARFSHAMLFHELSPTSDGHEQNIWVRFPGVSGKSQMLNLVNTIYRVAHVCHQQLVLII